jgi:hypothetical protein
VPHSSTRSPKAGTDWMQDAACLGQIHLDYFDLDCSLQPALELCAICPVGDRCLDYAVAHNLTEGVWGGAWGEELIGIVRGRRRRRGQHAD